MSMNYFVASLFLPEYVRSKQKCDEKEINMEKSANERKKERFGVYEMLD